MRATTQQQFAKFSSFITYLEDGSRHPGKPGYRPLGLELIKTRSSIVHSMHTLDIDQFESRRQVSNGLRKRKGIFMNIRLSTLLVATVLSLWGCANTPPVDHSAHLSSTETNSTSKGGMHAMGERMQKMKDQMARIKQSKDPAERQKLMEEHMKLMEEHMSGMEKMK